MPLEAFRLALMGCKSGEKSSSSAISGEFPQFFPQVWKTLGGDQTYMPFVGVPRSLKEDADCSTTRPALTLPEWAD
jgi:hypothetical protein